MLDLSDLKAIKKIDPQDTLTTTGMMVEQCKAAWDDVTTLELSKRYENIHNVVFCGMGASIYGALVLKAVLGVEMPFPSEVVTDYFLPSYVGPNTLVVLTSYSGTTEEVLSCAEEAKAKNAKMLVLTKGGPLAEFARDNKIPAYIFDGKLNLSSTPRLGCGYTILGLMGLVNRMTTIDLEEHEITNAITRAGENFEEIKKQAFNDYQLFANKIPIIFAAEHLSGNAQILRNQFNETSKTFSSHFLIPDLNHHLMEGLQFPEGAPLQFIVLNSPNYSEKIKKRAELTMEVVKKNNYIVREYMTSGATVYDDFLESMLYGSFVTLYLALEYKQNPATNPWVDWFKGKLSSEK